MALRRKAYFLLGVVQTIIGVSITLFSYALYFNIFNVRSLFNLSEESIIFYFVILLSIGIIIIANSIFLLMQWLKYRI